MAKTQSHQRAQGKAAGKKGRTEVKLRTGKILDAVTKSGKRITEVERSGTTLGLKKAVRRLKSRKSKQKILQVPQKDVAKAAKIMRDLGVKGSVKNMSNTKRKSVRSGV